MPFEGYLTPEDMNRLIKAAIDSGLVLADREVLFAGVFRPFALSLFVDGDPVHRFAFTLAKTSSVERLANGQVPLAIFLQNCTQWLQLRGLPQATVFGEKANGIGNCAAGMPPMPTPAGLPEVIRNEAIVGVDDMVDFAFLAGGLAAGRSVARIVVPRFDNGVAATTREGAPWIMTGTAWLLSPKLVLTNHHVINARKSEEGEAGAADFARQGREAVVEFDFNAAGDPKVEITSTGVVAASTALDYALLRLASDPGRSPLKIRSSRVVTNATTYLPVNILQHPRGQPKRLACRNNLVTGADQDTLRYFTDTDFGSSGAPVCDDAWQVLALHRGARIMAGLKYQGKDVAYVNFGSQIQSVLEDLRQKVPDWDN